MLILHKIKKLVNRTPLLQSLYNASRLVIQIIPFYLVREYPAGNVEEQTCCAPAIEHIDVVSLGEEDMKTISETPGVRHTRQELVKRLSDGWLCLGLNHHSRMIAWMWSNPNACDSRLLRFPLRENEAYLTDARTLEEFRGKNLAPYLRQELYRRLRDMGRTEIYSITEYFNRPAVAFKKKLGAKASGFYLHVLLLKKLEFTVRLRKY